MGPLLTLTTLVYTVVYFVRVHKNSQKTGRTLMTLVALTALNVVYYWLFGPWLFVNV